MVLKVNFRYSRGILFDEQYNRMKIFPAAGYNTSERGVCWYVLEETNAQLTVLKYGTYYECLAVVF